MVSDDVHGTLMVLPVSVFTTIYTEIGTDQRWENGMPRNRTESTVFRCKPDLRTFRVDRRQLLGTFEQNNRICAIHRHEQEVHGGHSGLTCTKQLCHLNGYSNTNAELTCCLIQVEIATVVLEFDISSIILWEHIDLNAAYVLSRSYRIRVFEGMKKGALLLQLLGLRQCILGRAALQRILGVKTLFICYLKRF